MVVIIQKNAKQEQIDRFIDWLGQYGLQVHLSVGAVHTILGLVGDTSRVDADLIRAMDIVEDVRRIQEPYKNANRKFHPENTVVKVGNTYIGDGSLTMIAGPCSIETEEQIITVARAVKAAGATLLRGGAFKPRSSPYAFQGLGAEGLKMLLAAKKETGLPVVTELMNLTQLPLFEEVDLIQVGARNMQNFDLLKELGRQPKPVLLKRGLSSTMEELLMSAEYIMAGGNEQVVLCGRASAPLGIYPRPGHFGGTHAKQLSHLPVVVDPSPRHRPIGAASGPGCGGCRGRRLMIEVHNDPARALCDGPQSLTPRSMSSGRRMPVGA